ncbi:MAG: FHA domain-containing protein [Polyangiales bacterium]
MIRFRQTKGADAGREFEFDQDLIRIGRMPDSDVNFDPEVDLDASGRHAEIRHEDGRYLLIDTGSRNGTWLNGERIKHAALHAGDQIELGRGGPELVIAFVEGRPLGVRPSGRAPTAAALRDPRFDPLAMPVTTATRLQDLVGRPDLIAERTRVAKHDPAVPRNRRRRRSSALLWGAVGVLLLSALAIVVVASLR